MSNIKEIDEIIIPNPEKVELEIIDDTTVSSKSQIEREVMLHGALEDGDRFRIRIKGKFAITYEVGNVKTKKKRFVYKEETNDT